MKKAIAAFVLSLILLFAAGRPAVTLADEYMDFEDDQDTVLFEFDGTEMMFSTKLPDANGKELGIYKKNDDDTYSLYRTYHFEENLSRMAGNLFTCHGKLYRPAQVCIKSYGDAISLQEVLFNNGEFQFKEIRRLYSPSPIYDLGFHTFNVFNDSIVVDGLGYRKYYISNILKKLWHIIKFI